MGLKVYGLPMSTNTARVIACLNEKGLEYELVPVDLRTGAHKQQPFISLNPFGQLPAFQDGDLTLFESRAITKYIAEKYKGTGPDLLRQGSITESAIVGVWLEVEAQQFGPPIADLVLEILIKPMLGGTTDPQAVEIHAEKLAKVLDVYEERLTKTKYIAGDHFTLVDLHHLPYTFCLMNTPKASLITCRPHVLAWWEDISSRPAWKKTAEGIKYGP
ncbi:glutathione S-transferase-like [Magnolia sinica]|uniref:glutathione S-transferase-like n=1 Tax=Magnolia sinica TaxID=86752 RepID=UPI0026586833|nr:glutathione S-transferase-like [Magnolia sinica]